VYKISLVEQVVENAREADVNDQEQDEHPPTFAPVLYNQSINQV